MISWAVATSLVGVAGIALVGRTRLVESLLSPFVLASFVIVAIFGIRPLILGDSSGADFYGLDVSTGRSLAAQVGFVAILALNVGFWIRTGAGTTRAQSANSLRPLSPCLGPGSGEPARSFRRALVTSLVLNFLWVVLMAAFGGGLGVIGVIFGGRSDATSERLTGLPAGVFAFPVAAGLVLAVTRLIVERSLRLNRLQASAYWAGVFLSVLPPVSIGVRRYMLPVVLASVAASLASRYRRRIGARHLLGAGAVLILLAAIPYVRSAGARSEGSSVVEAMRAFLSTEGITGTSRLFFVSYDTEMFDYVSFIASERWPESLPSRGSWMITDTLLSPFPEPVLQQLGEQTFSDHVLVQTFGGSCAERFCPVPSLPGVLYYDLGFVGVGAGMFLVGVACRRYSRSFHSSSWIRVLWSVTALGFAPALIRGDPMTGAWIAANVVALAAIAVRLADLRLCEESNSSSSAGEIVEPGALSGTDRSGRAGASLETA